LLREAGYGDGEIDSMIALGATRESGPGA